MRPCLRCSAGLSKGLPLHFSEPFSAPISHCLVDAENRRSCGKNKAIMKKWIVVLIGAGVALGAGYYLNRSRSENVSTPDNSSTPADIEQVQARPNDAVEVTRPVVKKREDLSPPPASQPIAKPAPAATAVAANPNVDAAFLLQAVDLLV